MDFPSMRASILLNGGDPRVVDTMSLYELLSMFRAVEKLRKKAESKTTGPAVTDEEWKEAEALLTSVTLHDPSVRIH